MLCRCRFYPSCSEYTHEAIADRGVVAGILKGLLRILRCNPLFPGGYEPYVGSGLDSRQTKLVR